MSKVTVAQPNTLKGRKRRYTALVTDEAFDDFMIERSVLEPIGCAVVTLSGDDLAGVEAADAFLVSRATIDAELMGRARRLKVIARYGVGVDNIDLETAARRGITVVNTPDYCAHEVADHALAQILACARQIVRLDRLVHSGQWNPADVLPMQRLARCTLGIIGIGHVGSQVAARALALGLEVIAHDPFIEKPPVGVVLVPLDDLLRRSDFVSLHMPLTPSTRNLIGAPQLALMKRTAFLVNTARGDLIDEDELATALRDGRLAGAALDVLTAEPPGLNHPLIKLENVILTPHIAFYSDEALRQRKRQAAEGVRAVLESRRPEFTVSLNPGGAR